jgi:NADPH2:quinone reductase
VSGAPDTMRAWQSIEPGINGLTLTTSPCPRASAGQALIRVEAAALNFSDLLMIDDRYQIRPPRPFIPGQEIAGFVVTAGEGCALAVGDRVAGKVVWGAFADYAVMRDDMAIGIPPGVAAVTAVALPIVYTTAMVALTESTQVKRGEDVLVLAAAGGVGLAAVEIAHVLGARVIAAAGGAEKCALACAHGADDAIDYRKSGWSEAVNELTHGRGVAVVIDPVGGGATKEALRALAWEGRLLVVGFASGEIPMISASRLLLSRAAAIGVYWNHDRDAAMLARIAQHLTSLLASGAIHPHIGKEFPFAQLPQALTALAERHITGKAILSLTDKDRLS